MERIGSRFKSYLFWFTVCINEIFDSESSITVLGFLFSDWNSGVDSWKSAKLLIKSQKNNHILEISLYIMSHIIC